MKRLLVFLMAVFLLTGTCFASTVTDELLNQGMEQFKAEELLEHLPQTATDLAGEMGIESFSWRDLLKLTPKELFNAIKLTLTSSLREARATLFSIIATVLLCAALGALGQQGEAAQVFEGVSVLAITAALGAPVIACVSETARVIIDASRFLLSYVPIYSAVITAGGQPASAAAYSLSVMAAAQLTGQLAAGFLIPLCGVYLALSITGGISSNTGIEMLSGSIKKLITWSLSLAMTLFVGVLTLQSFMTSAADSATVKTTKFLVGTFVPVVGGAIADALSSAQGCMRLIKATVGSFGIAVAALTFLPPLANLIVLRLVVAASLAAGETLGARQIRSVLTGFGNALTVLTALLLSMGLLMIISTAVMMSAGGGGV